MPDRVAAPDRMAAQDRVGKGVFASGGRGRRGGEEREKLRDVR